MGCRAVFVPMLLGLSAAAPIVHADSLQQPEALAILQKIADAARKLNYAGTFVYQHGDQVETSRIVHFAEGDDEIEKLETLDGPRREVIRNNDEVLCYYPDAKVVRSDKRVARRTFPALLPEQLSTLTEFYDVRKGEPERIAGFDSSAVVLDPKDGFRYGHKFWAESNSGLLLKARMLNDRRAVVEQFSFTQLVIGAGVTREMTQSSYSNKTPEWRTDRFAESANSNVVSGWVIKSIPAGFRKVMEMQRTKQGRTALVTHIVVSDGLAAVSIFIEPVSGKRQLNDGLFQQGAINIYTRTLNDQVITVLGEAPAPTVMQIGNSVVFQGK